MTEKDLLKQLSELKDIKPNTDWAVSVRQNLINYIEINQKTNNANLPKTSILFKKLPNFSLVPVAILALLLVFSINLFSFEGLKFGGLALKNSQNQIASIKNDADSFNSFNNVNNITNPATEGVANARLEQLPVDTLASVKVYDDDVSTAFRAMLVERINRITVFD